MNRQSPVSTARWIDREDTLAAWLHAHAGAADAIGIDTEFVRETTFYPRLALIQLAIGADVVLVDPLTCSIAPLRGWLDSGTARCILHSAGEDIEALRGVLPDGPPRLYDTQLAAAFAGLGAGIGYQALVASLRKLDLPKDATRSDWLRRPLSPTQLAYAEQDVAHLGALRASLDALLQRRGYTAWFEEDCARLRQRAHDRIDEQPQRGLRAAAGWPIEALARLRSLLLWREHNARLLDVPRGWLLHDEHCLDLAFSPPDDAEALAVRTRGQRALRARQRADLLGQLHRPPEAGFVAATQRPDAAPDGAHKRMLAALRAHVDAEARRLDLPAGLLCPRRTLEALATTGRWPDEPGGWRQALLAGPLASLLP